MVDEIRREVGSGPLTSTNLAALEYTKRVIMETLRMYPPGAPGALLAGPCPFMLCDCIQATVTLCPNCTPFPQCLSLDLHATAPRTCLATTTLPGAHSSPTLPTASIAARYATCPSAPLLHFMDREECGMTRSMPAQLPHSPPPTPRHMPFVFSCVSDVE